MSPGAMHLTAANQSEDLGNGLVRVSTVSSTVTVTDCFITGIRKYNSLAIRSLLLAVTLAIISTTLLNIFIVAITQSHPVDKDYMGTPF